MEFLASLLRWLEPSGTARRAIPAAADTNAPPRNNQQDSQEPEVEPEITVGGNCLLTVTDRLFMVEIVEVNDETIRVSFPGIDYPVDGMLVELEFHDHTGFSVFQAKVITGPRRDGDGILLELPTVSRRQQHRESARIPTDLSAQIKDPAQADKFDGRILNLSTGGALIETEAKFNLGDTIEIIAHLPERPETILAARILYIPEPRETDQGVMNVYGTSFVSFEPGAGRALTRYIWDRLRELYPSV